MAKKPASFEYNGTLVKVLDGDTIDCYIKSLYHRMLSVTRYQKMLIGQLMD